jgi:deferrochelatase/peroxidase EfeB
LLRMAGAHDGIIYATLRMSKPVSDAYFWCPSVRFSQF